MEPVLIHSWALTPGEAVALQLELRDRLKSGGAPPLSRLAAVAGLDVSYSRSTDTCYAAVVVTGPDGHTVLETATAVARSTFPYVPGLLSFREIPPLVQALSQLTTVPDVLLVDGQGRAHPRRFGLACHLGALYDLPAVGCAKSRLCGRYSEPADAAGAWSVLRDEKDNRLLGSVVRTRRGVKPVFVSVGARCDDAFARSLILSLASRARLPEPIRLAHRLSNAVRLECESRHKGASQG